MKTSDQNFNLEFDVDKIDVFVFRTPADPPVETSFGTMRDRPAVLLRVRDRDGAEGWGEIWCNFPVVGAEHRGRLAATYLPPIACGRRWASPLACMNELTRLFAVLAIQSGEPGPLQQIVAGLDVAIWDLLARKAGLPLWKLLDVEHGDEPPVIAVYASGLNPTNPENLAAQKLSEGYRAFKLKVGFGESRDQANLKAVREVIGPHVPFMVDANQAWTVEEAILAGRSMADYDLGWLEEPIRADSSALVWARLGREQPLKLAGGENLSGTEQFVAFAENPGISVVQPDVGKWGGFSGCVMVGKATLDRKKLFCPHWLGAGVGLAASFHLKAAVGGPGYVEVDANPNQLRDIFAAPVFQVKDGCVSLTNAPGLGIKPDVQACKELLVWQS